LDTNIKDEGKRFLLETMIGKVVIDNQQLKAQLKNLLDHRHLDLEYLIAKTKQEGATMEVKTKAEVMEKMVKYYEDNMDKELVYFNVICSLDIITY
jgi:chaperonin cofactor prefoldin